MSDPVVVLGSGPGGYAAAFRAADLGLDVVLVEREETLGGVCLNVGCIPSKALLHAAKVIRDAQSAGEMGIGLGEPEIDLDKLRANKDAAVQQLTKGVAGMADRRKVRVVHGTGRLTGERELTVELAGGGADGDAGNGDGGGETETIAFSSLVLAAGSAPVVIPGVPEGDDRIWDSTAALELRTIPDRLLVIGGGIIGLEMATVYAALGSAVTVVEMADQLVPGCDPDLVKPLARRLGDELEAIHTGTLVASVEASDDELTATFGLPDGAEGNPPEPQAFDAVLVAVGRRADGPALGLDAAGVEVDGRGQIPVDAQRRTNVDGIYAIGDLTPGPMLAHKATHEGHVAAEAIAGETGAAFDPRGIPAVAYTDPELAWVGLTETQAKADGVEVATSAFPWAASGRAITSGGESGRTKLLHDPETGRILGGGIVGPGAGELIAEVALAIEMGAVLEDVALTIHPHPTLSETVGLAAEVGTGSVTDLPPKRR